MSMHLNWKVKTWDELSLEAFYRIAQLRIDVFVIEQDCPYQDLDGKDQQSVHLWAEGEGGEVLAYLRIVAPGVSYPQVAIGRVISSSKMRGTGLGIELMKRGIEAVNQQYGDVAIKLSAQQYLIKFYEKFGFQTVGEGYLEDDIPHIAMIRKGAL
ncbi:MAG: GNAT family N-acetyltransferase [Flavobacteriales bacterium]|nr:GNAT family N-acetyltransferase [Flavobacteriales bacterium]MDG1767390.1 GNAT family N-acetyltransferase [Flavobacteriales bacterium]